MGNAIKYTPAPGQIIVQAELGDNQFVIRVSDTGPGILLQEQQQVFDPFYRGIQRQRFPQGLGLGLTIARQIVEAHGGGLDLAQSSDAGSQFVVSLPLS